MSLSHRTVVTAAVVLFAAAVAGPARADHGCPSLSVPGTAYAETACLDDLTTAGTTLTGHTDRTDWQGLHAPGTRNPSGVPGIQVDGYFLDSSRLNHSHGWDHDSQFVLRLPRRWNGGLVITGAPGVREQYANDFIIGDWVLAQGYAFASTDKGNVGVNFYTDGVRPGDAVAEWNRRMTQLARAARATAAGHYHRPVRRTYVTGISNGGYLTRWQLEHHPELYDGGVDWEGTLFTADGPNLLTFLPPALRHYPKAAAGYPFCAPDTIPGCDADYDYASRPAAVRDAMARVSLTGDVRKPMITLHGTLDSLLPIRVDSDVYAELGSKPRYRYYRIEGGNHVDGLYPLHPRLVRPMLPCYRAAFTALEAWVDRRTAPPPSATLPRPDGDVVNHCALS